MCGIFAVFGIGEGGQNFRERAVALSKRIRHRGPDWSGVKVSGNNILCHERLAIVGVESSLPSVSFLGMRCLRRRMWQIEGEDGKVEDDDDEDAHSGAQPLTNEDESVILSVNGEIYNHVTLRKALKKPHKFKTHSDCEVILYMYEEMGTDFISHLDGMFSFVLYDKKKDIFIAARDHVGITTLYQGWRSTDHSVWFASEMKSLHDECDRIIAFPPGHFYNSQTKETKQYYRPAWYDHIAKGLPSLQDENKVQTEEEDKAMYTALRTSLERSVKKRLMSEVPYGVLLSGGLDSSLIASIAMRMRIKEMEVSAEDDDIRSAISSAAAWPRLHSFSIGLPGSPDLKAARRVADFLKTVHHEFTFTVQEGLDAISEVIWHLETYDVTTVRASTPMWLLSRKIKAMGVKMVLSGECSD
ncbi:asparagine synthetase [Blyttiomyces sp. JEL0837]|nr:asparagine synthetase [Blyttiomyces sp. JEL0837]